MIHCLENRPERFLVRLFRWLRPVGLALLALPMVAVDLSVSAYTWAPDPVVRNGLSTFTVTVTNNDAGASVGNLTLTVNLPSNLDFSASTVTVPSGSHTLPSPYTNLTCTRAAALAPQGTWVVTFTGVGNVAGTQNTTATVTASGNTDLNPDNDFLTKPTTVINGADLSVNKTGPATCLAGDTISFTVRVTNHGPDPATTFRVTDNLPAGVDFSYGSATGTGWTFNRTGTTLTCDYAGAAVPSGADAPDITVTGTVTTTLGSITNGASVVSTDGTTGDPVAGNNGPSQAVVTVTPGTNLRANKTMVSAATGMTTYASGEAVTLTLSATNLGPQDATGVVLTDVVPAHFTLLASSGAGWTASGQSITCTVGNLASGATSSTFTIPLLASGVAGSSGTNTATIARTAPASGVNASASVAYTIVDAFAHLTIAKSKGPTPVAENGLMTSTIVVTNDMSSTSAVTGTIRITDALSVHEAYVSFSGTGWSAVDTTSSTLVFEYTGANLARGASLPALTITTRAETGYLGDISNTACIVGSSHTPPDNVSGDCDSATVTGTDRSVNIGVVKTASIPAPTHITTTDASYSYTIAVTNSGVDVAPTVVVTDPLAMWYSGDAGTTTGSAVVSGGGTATFGSTVTATLLGLNPGETRTLTITLNRPFRDGSFTNMASVSLPDSIDTDPSDNSATADVIIDPIADVAITNIADAPDPVKVGVELTYTTSIKNNGPSTAAGVVADHRIDTARMAYVPGSASLTVGGTATYHASLPDGAYVGQPGIRCEGFSLTNGESRQLTFKVIPVYPYPDALTATYTSTAAISTTTAESSTANNTATNDAHVTLQALDLSVTDNDPGFDPTAFGDAITYQITAQNNGPSQATGFVLTVTPTPPAGGNPDPYTMVFDAAGSTLPAGATYTTSGGNLLFFLGADQAHSVLAPNSSKVFSLKFSTGPLTDAPASSITYRTTAAVSSYETLAGHDTLTGNNSVTETTTVLPKTDLILVSKTVSKPTVDLNEPFTYAITVGNKGPSDVSGLTVTDALPSGFVMTGAPTVTPGSAVTLTTSSVSAPAVGSGGTLTFTLGPLPADTTGTDTTKQVVLTVPVRAAYQSSGTYAFGFGPNIPNTATVAVVPGVSLDPDGTNNSQTVNVQVRRNSLAGVVFRDTDTTLLPDATAKTRITATLTLTGTDAYGYTYGPSSNYPALTRTSNGSGFSFDVLPPGSWTLVEIQPNGYSDGREAAGTAGGTAPPNVLDGSLNGTSLAAHNTIGGIVLPADASTLATGYLFQEFQNGTISGFVYHDANNDGNRDAGETTGIAMGLHLTGTDYRGLTYSPINVNTAGGAYTFSNVPPGTGYVVSEASQPAGYFDGLEQNGTGLGNVIAGSKATDLITVGTVATGTTYGNRNFGELSYAALGGYVFIDQDGDAVRDGGETAGAFGVTVTLTGIDDLGDAVNAVTTSGANGQYSFGALRPGSYAVTETVPPGLTHTGAQAGSKGGTIDGSVRTAGTGITGPGVTDISLIPVASGDAATGYNFGETGQGLTGFVYVDLDGDGTKDTGEPGIPGITVTLSGQTSGGEDVCVAISPNPCTVTTDGSGAYSFTGLPTSNGAGYTLTEQSQASAPLSNYGDGADAIGSLGGSVSNDRFSGIPLTTASFGTGYNFGERGGSISGRVYLDVDRDGTYNAGDNGLAGITITLSGTTASSANVCTVLPTCTFTTGAGGLFSIAGLPAGTYTLTETQPADYANATTAVGTGGGTGGGTTVTGISVSAGSAVTGYLFGEKTGSLGGHVYLDTDNDGVKDLGENGIAGTSLRLTGTSAGGGAIDVTVTTTSDGSYIFDNLPNANGSGYVLTETQPSGYLDGRHTAGSGGGNVTVANITSVIPFSGAAPFTNYNFGEVLGTGISGRVYHDADNDGVFDTGEALAGVSVTLSGIDDRGAAVLEAATTAADGTYSFTNLRPSDATGYILSETQPTGIGNYPAATGTLVGTLGGTAALDQVSGIVLASGQSGAGYDFRENASSLSGFVYMDVNDNGAKDGGEAGIPGVTVTLSGSASATAVTAPDGGYSFLGLVAGTYTLTETHPVIYQDGREGVGSPAGTVDNSSFTFAAVQNRIGGITLPAGTAGTGYLFGERSLIQGSFSGRVWFDLDHDRVKDSGEPDLAGWRVEVRQGGNLVRTTTTGSAGTWAVTGLSPNTDYEIRFRHPSIDAFFGDPVSQDLVYNNLLQSMGLSVDYSAHTIAGLLLPSGADVQEQNLPIEGVEIDPSGVVYDAITRIPVSGATVTITGPAGFNAAAHLLGGASSQSQVTDATGFYQFQFLPTTPAGTYTLAVNGPPAYVPGASTIIPPTPGPLNPGAGPGSYLVQTQASAPTGSESTTYYLAFALNGLSTSVANNHLPIDPVLGGAIFVTKTTPKVNVVRGELVPYTITARNTLAATLSNIDLVDEVPPGFKYVSGSARVDGVKVEPVVTGRQLRWRNLIFAANQNRTITLVLVVGSGVGEGEYTNRAWALNHLVNTAVSNVGTATVRIVPDPTFDCTDIIGKVFDDRNANGFQDEGEPGLPNIVLATVKGRLITTDAEGRYHIPCAEVPQMDRGSNFILKLDARTLPSGYRMTTENPRVVRATRGKMVKLNFGAALHRVIRLEVSDAAFEGDALKPEWKGRFEELPRLLAEKPGVVRLVYRHLPPDKQRAKERLDALAAELRKRWKERDDRYPLSIELERVEVTR